jgi:hypothetical protein
MRRLFLPVLVTAATLLGLSVAAPASADIAGSGLACHVMSNDASGVVQTGSCAPKRASRDYVVEYLMSTDVWVVGWSTSQHVIAGCTAGVNYCDVSARSATHPTSFTATVYYTPSPPAGPGWSLILASSATADIDSVCGQPNTYYTFC